MYVSTTSLLNLQPLRLAQHANCQAVVTPVPTVCNRARHHDANNSTGTTVSVGGGYTCFLHATAHLGSELGTETPTNTRTETYNRGNASSCAAAPSLCSSPGCSLGRRRNLRKPQRWPFCPGAADGLRSARLGPNPAWHHRCERRRIPHRPFHAEFGFLNAVDKRYRLRV